MCVCVCVYIHTSIIHTALKHPVDFNKHKVNNNYEGFKVTCHDKGNLKHHLLTCAD